MRSVVIILATVGMLSVGSEAYRVLVVFPIMGKSHSILGEGYVKALLKAGHQVQYLTPFPIKSKDANLTQVTSEGDLSQMGDIEKLLNISNLLSGNSVMSNTNAIPFIATQMFSNTMQHKNVQQMISDPTQEFDLVVCEWFFSELCAGFAVLYQCPLVWFSSMDVHSLILRLVDEYPNPAYTPDAGSSNRPPFSFLQRVKELFNTLRWIALYEFVVIPQVESMYEKYFGPAAAKRGVTLPPYREVIYNVSMILANGHPSLGDAPKLPQNVKEIGGYHIETLGPLPQDLKKIMDDATEGVIYFSMGSNMKSKDLPDIMKKQLLDMFGQLKQTVLWKFEDDTLKSVPANVHIRSWMPQQSILAHPNTRFFITHGGLLSTTETVHFGVPAVMIPLFADQFLNADMAVKRGFAVQVSFTYDLAKDLSAAIKEIIVNPSYRNRVKHLSSLYHDRPMTPAQELVYWLEYVVRTGGAPHLRSAALLVPWYQKFYLDLLALVLGLILVSYILLRRICIKLFGSKKQNKSKTNKRD